MTVSNMPQVLYKHLAEHNVQQFEPAWIQLEAGSSNIMSVGGHWQSYFEVCPVVGDDLLESCAELMGILPIVEDIELPQIQLREACYTDISCIHGADCDWVVFRDVSQQTLQLQKYQQVSNELVLLKGQLKQTLERYVGHEVAGRVVSGRLRIDEAGERRLISTLFVDIRGFTPFNESHDVQMVMQTLNEYLKCMIEPIMYESGMVDKIMGDGVMAVFGVLASDSCGATCAFAAAQGMLQRVKQLNEQRYEQGLEQLGVGVGIATGEALLGMLGTHERRSFTAVGRHVNFAARLESNARVGEILLDEESYKALTQGELFRPVGLALKGIGEVKAYSCVLPCINESASS